MEAARQTQGRADANASIEYAGKTLPCVYFQLQRGEPRHKDYDTQSAACQVTAYLKRKSFTFLYSSPPSLRLPLQLPSLGSKLWSPRPRYLCSSPPAERLCPLCLPSFHHFTFSSSSSQAWEATPKPQPLLSPLGYEGSSGDGPVPFC